MFLVGEQSLLAKQPSKRWKHHLPHKYTSETPSKLETENVKSAVSFSSHFRVSKEQ
jgi:hypothetical protein